MSTTDDVTSENLQNGHPRLVIHVDDVGMCHGTNAAFVQLSRRGAVSAGSVMVPCPWSSEILELAATDGSLDLGVHLTLNAEQRHYRWGPVGGHPDSAGLVDDDGYLWRSVAEVRAHAHPDAVETEWRAQIDRALAAGVDITHLDTHMGSALAPEWCDRYVQLGVEYDVPVLITNTLDGYGPHRHIGEVDPGVFDAFVTSAHAAGQPVFTRVLETDFSRPAGTPVDYRRQFTEGTAGLGGDDLVYAALHPCRPGPGEIEVIEPDQHHVRTDEYREFSDPWWPAWLDHQNAEGVFEVLTMRTLRAEYRSRNGTGDQRVG
jgi:predicted glycoside hydrolase/deacetylase ChbG (UPF0249 family)